MPDDNDVSAADAVPVALDSSANDVQQEAAQPAAAEEPSVFAALANKLGLPAEVTQQIRGDSPPAAPEAAAPAASEEHSQENQETQDEDGEPKANPFDDERVQKRLGKEARQKERMLRAAGFDDDEIAAIKERGQDPAEAIAARIKAQPQSEKPQPSGPAAPVSKGLLGNIVNEEQLGQWKNYASSTLSWCDQQEEKIEQGEEVYRQNQQGEVERDPNGNPVPLRQSDINKARRSAENILLEVPIRKQEIRDGLSQRYEVANKVEAIIQKHYGKLFDPESDEAAEATRYANEDEIGNSLLRDYPDLKNDPRIRLFMARYLAGYKAEKGKPGSSNRNPDLPESLTRSHPPLAPHAPSAPPSRANGSNALKRLEEAKRRVYDGGGTDAIKDVLRANAELEKRERRDSRAPALA